MIAGNNKASLARKSNSSVAKKSAVPTVRNANALNGVPSNQDVLTTTTNETLRNTNPPVVNMLADEIDLATRPYIHLECGQSAYPPATTDQWHYYYLIPYKE
jgi:hypothetical protein